MEPAEMQEVVEKLEELVEKTDWGKDHRVEDLLLRSRNLAAALLDPYVLFHTKVVASLVKKRGGDRIDEVAAWLHDTGRVVTDDGHRDVGYLWAKKWLKKFYITDEEIERILDGIKNHGTKDDPKTKTGKMLKLVDALAVFDEGWAAMILKYYESVGKIEKAIKMLRKKASVIHELGSPEDVEEVERVAKMFGIEV